MILHMCYKFGKSLGQQVVEDALVGQDAKHVRIIINGQHVLDNLYEYPEALLLVQMLQQIADNEIHALAVTNGRISLQERVQDIPQRANIFIHDVGRVVRERALQVELYLVEARVRVVDVVVSQDKVIILVRFLINKHAI
jgi:predicted RNA-binding protein